MADWKEIRNDYELMHSSVKELCASHHVGEQLIEHAIKSEGWVHISGDDIDTTDLSERLTALDVYHQRTLVPKFISLQSKMLDKCDTLLDDVKGIDDANNLKIVSEVIEKHRPTIMGVKKDGAQDNQMTIKIATQVGGGDQPSVSAVQITQSAGQANGVGAVNYGFADSEDK